MSLAAIILGAGLGTRMRSSLPKVLHDLAEEPLINHVVDTCLIAGASPVVVVVGYGAAQVRESVRARFGRESVRFATQREQRGTGHAARCGLAALREVTGDALVLYGDMPLLRASSLRNLARERRRRRAPLSLATICLPDAGTYGRVIREEHNRVTRVVEARDASEAELAVREINVGLYATRLDFLRKGLRGLRADNAQGELYLTDLVASAAAAGGVADVVLEDVMEALGINDRRDLAQAEATWRRRRADELMLAGVRLEDPERLQIGVRATVEADARIGAGVHLLGDTHVSAGAWIGPGVILRDVQVGAQARIGAYSVLERVEVAAGAMVEPHAVLGTPRG